MVKQSNRFDNLGADFSQQLVDVYKAVQDSNLVLIEAPNLNE